MNILAIACGHNATVGLIKDDKLAGLLSQEKIDNIKNSATFPADAIHALMAECDLTLEAIDEVVIASNDVYPPEYFAHLVGSDPDQKNIGSSKPSLKARTLKTLEKIPPFSLTPGLFRALRQMRADGLRKQGRIVLAQELENIGLASKPLHFVDHHQCHAYAAYYGMEHERGQPALIFTSDGSGDGLCATVSKVDADGTITRLAETDYRHSLGGIYSHSTAFLGMRILEHEYKVMGLAPYAKEQYAQTTYERLFKPVFDLDPENPMRFKSTVPTGAFYDHLCKNAVGERFDNIAAAAQMLLEDVKLRWIKHAIEQTGIRRIFTGGGTFMNVKLNKRIQEMPEIDYVGFLPSCGDESLVIGALATRQEANGDARMDALEHLYMGISFSDEQMKDFIVEQKLDEKYHVTLQEDMEAKLAELLADREVVARVAGRCEWGARSLGNRAILAHPSHMESFYTVNDTIKSRDFWMPFAPSMLDTAAPEYLVDYQPEKAPAPYMITACSATELGKDKLRAALHQGDHTLRPQVVKESAAPDYYRLIKLFEEKSGVGAVLNTSFNLHGYPLVATPEQALMTLENSKLRHLALGSWLIQKKD